jgi:hypothetical protein
MGISGENTESLEEKSTAFSCLLGSRKAQLRNQQVLIAQL